MTNATKPCGECRRVLPTSEFYARKDGRLSSDCKECIRAARRDFRAREGERINARRRERYVPTGRTPEERFMERVGKRGDCWWWEGSVDKDGYGWFWADGSTVTAHRFSYELANGPIPDGLQVLHSCDTPTCVNPDHLLAGSHKQNVEERWERNPAWGESHHRCKYSADDVREIRRLAAEGLTYAQIGERFGTGRIYIGEIVRGESRADVPD